MESAKDKSLKYFRQAPHFYNCAQSVAYGCGREDLIESLANSGVGKAKDGLCGALFAAIEILGSEKSEEILAEFQAKTGAVKCLNLKKDCKVPCPICVATAAEIIEKKLMIKK